MDDDLKLMGLVAALRDRLSRNQLIRVTSYRNPMGLIQPGEIEGHQPDLVARVEPAGKLLIGLARVGEAVSSEESIEDYRFFGSYRESEAADEAAFNLAVPKAQEAEAKAALAKTGLRPEQYFLMTINEEAQADELS